MTAVAALLLAAALLMLPQVGRGRLRELRDPSPVPAADVQSPQRRAGTRSADPLSIAASLDLLAACLRAGLPTAMAAKAVAPSAPSPLAEALQRGADLLMLGADPASAWDTAAGDAETEALARAARRSARSGAPLSGVMTELATQRRSDAEDGAAAAAERAGVLISGPLGLCFLPAFICVGIIPVVVGLAGRVLDGGLL